jgi:hypothetical protein
MAVTEMELNEALSRAASLMSPEGQRQIEYAGRQNRNSYDIDGGYVQPSGSHGMRESRPSQSLNRPKQNSTSRLPKVIMESISNNPLDDVMNEYSTGGSVLDTLGYTPKAQPSMEQIRESYIAEPQYSAPSQPYYQPVQHPQYMAQPQIQTIDYNYIRAIVNECVKANIQQIKDEILKESTLKTIRIGGENKIQLIDNKNNLYESRLEFKKNISKK